MAMKQKDQNKVRRRPSGGGAAVMAAEASATEATANGAEALLDQMIREVEGLEGLVDSPADEQPVDEQAVEAEGATMGAAGADAEIESGSASDQAVAEDPSDQVQDIIDQPEAASEAQLEGATAAVEPAEAAEADAADAAPTSSDDQTELDQFIEEKLADAAPDVGETPDENEVDQLIDQELASAEEEATEFSATEEPASDEPSAAVAEVEVPAESEAAVDTSESEPAETPADTSTELREPPAVEPAEESSWTDEPVEESRTVVDRTPLEREEPEAPPLDVRPAAEEAEEAFELPEPRQASGKSECLRPLVVCHQPSSRISEEYRSLRTTLLAQCRDERLCMVITSAEAGEGKTVTAVNLALALAERNDKKTIVVDADLRKGRIAAMLGLAESPGLAEVLSGQVELDQAIQSAPQANLAVLSAGDVSRGRAGELLARSGLPAVVERLRRDYDHVLFDTPSVNGYADAGMIGRAAGEVLLVVKMNATHRRVIEQAMALLRTIHVKLAGVVLTHRQQDMPRLLKRFF